MLWCHLCAFQAGRIEKERNMSVSYPVVPSELFLYPHAFKAEQNLFHVQVIKASLASRNFLQWFPCVRSLFFLVIKIVDIILGGSLNPAEIFFLQPLLLIYVLSSHERLYSTLCLFEAFWCFLVRAPDFGSDDQVVSLPSVCYCGFVFKLIQVATCLQNGVPGVTICDRLSLRQCLLCLLVVALWFA